MALKFSLFESRSHVSERAEKALRKFSGHFKSRTEERAIWLEYLVDGGKHEHFPEQHKAKSYINHVKMSF